MSKLPPHYILYGGLFDDLRDAPEWRWLLWGNLFALVPLGAAILLIWLPYQFYMALGTPLALFSAPDWSPIVSGLYTLIVIGASMLLHEALHALALWAQGYGARLNYSTGYFYATTAPGEALTRRAYVVMALTPLIALTLIGALLLLILPAGLGQGVLLALLLNAAGSVGDLAVTQRALRCPPDARFVDERGIRVYVPSIASSD